jgi:NADH-quinone oxidoreductase subunit H
MIPALTTVTVVPFGAYLATNGQIIPLGLAPIDIGILAVFAVASLSVYSQIIAGWASNSKYPFLGSVRATAQLISYELSMTLAVLPVFLWVNAPGLESTLCFGRVVEFQSGTFPHWDGVWFFFFMPLSAFIFLVALFAETNRQPFDTVESEADLVGSFHTEYGAFKWGLFFVAEYSHMIVGSAVFVLLFFGGWNPLPWIPLSTFVHWLHDVTGWAFTLQPLFVGVLSILIFLSKVLAMIFFFMWVRWTVPRFRYDQVMRLGWHTLLPASIVNLLFYAGAIAIIELW